MTYSEYIKDLALESLSGLISDEDRSRLEEEIRKNPAAASIYEEIAALYESEDFKRLVKKSDEEFPFHLITQESPSVQKRSFPVFKLAAAAMITVALGMGIYFYTSRSSPAIPQEDNRSITLKLANGKEINLSSNTKKLKTGNITLNNQNNALSYQVNKDANGSTGMNTLTVPVGLMYQLDLADGTKIWLNSATTLSFPFSFSGKREITVNGEAYLEIARDANKPFFVRLPGNNLVQVLGTSFNINTYKEDMHVALLSGAVNVKTESGASKTLQPGTEAIMTGNTLKTASFDPDHLLSWREGHFYFSRATLKEVGEVITRWYGVPVVIDNPKIANRTFKGLLNRNEPLEKFISNVEWLMDTRSYMKDGALHFD